jgi:4-diphosphocytidyl-2-C-methyl-D-erythritol kinase
MSQEPRCARLRALAKINLSLRVLQRRADGFHELRTIFQTVSTADIIDVEFTPSRRTSIELSSQLDVPAEDNLIVRAARSTMDTMRRTGRVRFRLKKRIPMGGGLGGGSSDAAAVLLALPVLAGVDLSLETLSTLGAELGSDVPYFLLGGTALGLGRGTELHPLPDAPRARGVLVNPGLNISTPDAYRALGRSLTPTSNSCNISSFQALSSSLGHGSFTEAWPVLGENDFEAFAYDRYPQLAAIRRKLIKLKARPVMMSGSGSTLFGIFGSQEQVEQARRAFRGQQVESFYLVSRGRYRRMWWRCLKGHLKNEEWPPRSRYAR